MSLTAAIAELSSAVTAPVSSLSDDELLQRQRELAGAARVLEMAAGRVAAEVHHRSRRELGYDGLAQKRGMRTPEALVQQVTSTSATTARRLVRVGVLVAQVEAHDADASVFLAEPWLEAAVRSAARGVISGEAVEVIRAGLGAPDENATVDALADAVRRLTAEAASVTVETLAARARELRDTLDIAGVAAREFERRERRYLRLFPQPDGMTRIVGLLDPESAAVIGNAIDSITSPRRGGPRFVDPEKAARAERIVADERTTEQLALDGLVELIDVAGRVRGSKTLGIRRADVRVLVTQHDLDRRAGVGFIDGQSATVSVATVERHACDGGLIPIQFDDDGRSLNLGRSKRLHNERQRTVIAARDGGCIAPDCERPASWCEVHHIVEFSKGGKTDVDDGVLLCRHHHLLVHNNEWSIRRTEGGYWLVPPPDIDPGQQPIPLHTKSAAVRRLLATA
jgi:hypothetical protein